MINGSRRISASVLPGIAEDAAAQEPWATCSVEDETFNYAWITLS
jgi:hypothetical protein